MLSKTKSITPIINATLDIYVMFNVIVTLIITVITKVIKNPYLKGFTSILKSVFDSKSHLINAFILYYRNNYRNK